MVEHLVFHKRTKLELQKHNHMNWIILHFFFDFRGGKGINNSFEGLLRSLLYQLIAIPQFDVQDVYDGKHDFFSDWHERRLRESLRTLLQNATGGVFIFVDGLDEYEGNVVELIQFLKSLATSNNNQKTSIKVCVSSRPEPMPTQLLERLPSLSMSDHNASGILSYCLRTLEWLEPEVREDLNISRLSHFIVNRAEGVFLWARFALEEFIRGYCSGEVFEELLMRLGAMPCDLEEVYDRMLSRIEPTAKQECMIMLQLVCFAKRSLSWQELLVATHTAMDKDVIISERVSGDQNSANWLKVYNTFARRLRAKAVGLLELVKTDDYNDEVAKLIHRSVSTYLNQKGWQTLGALKGESSIGAESLYVKICTRYLQCLLRHCKLETNTNQRIWHEWFNGRVFHSPERLPGRYFNENVGIYPFFAYAARYVFVHVKFLERDGAKSYPLIHSSLTEQLLRLHSFHADRLDFVFDLPCCTFQPRKLLFEDFDAIFVAFGHGLVSYCRSDLAIRSPAPGQVFWERALSCALFSCMEPPWSDDAFEVPETVSLALKNVTIVKQLHLEQARGPAALKLLLQHDSIKSLRLVDREGQAVTLLWLFTQDFGRLRFSSMGNLNLLLERAKDRGEDVRQSCGPDGNMVETSIKESPSLFRRAKLEMLREYYESRSWPFEYDPDEIDRVTDDGDLSSDNRSCSSVIVELKDEPMGSTDEGVSEEAVE